jgi:hypothetical protein
VLTDSIRKEYGELEQHLAPVLNTAGPLANNIHSCQIKHLKQCLIGRKDALAFRHLPEFVANRYAPLAPSSDKALLG